MNSNKHTSIHSFSKNRKGLSVWILFLISFVVFLILTPLVQKGCFIDGMLYKTVAYNYAEGLGFFWQMHFTQTSMAQFCEQPPLYFWLLGSVYKFTNEFFYTDRAFTFMLFVILIFVLNRTTTLLFKSPKPYFLLIAFFLLSIPVFCWSYVNQIIEPLLCIEISLGVLFFVNFIRSGKNGFIILFALVLWSLFLTKGFQSCFLVVLPLTYLILTKFKTKNFIFLFFSSILFLSALFFVLKFHKPALDWFNCYFDARLVLTLNNVGNTTDNHFEIIGRFFSELIVCLIIFVCLLSYLKFKKRYAIKFVGANFVSNKLALALLITAFAGSFPYAISLVQRGFYLIPSFICFILALVYGLKRYWLFLFSFFDKVAGYKYTRATVVMLALGSAVFFCFGFKDYKRNEEMLEDLKIILPHLNKGEVVLIKEDTWNDFSLHSYLYMAKQVSMSTERGTMLLVRSEEYSAPDSMKTRKIELPTKMFDLYQLDK